MGIIKHNLRKYSKQQKIKEKDDDVVKMSKCQGHSRLVEASVKRLVEASLAVPGWQ